MDHDAPELHFRAAFKQSHNTALRIWLLISVSAALIMAQDTYVGWNSPRLGTVDATAAFTKLMVMHVLWLFTSLAFIGFTEWIRPTSRWRWHILLAAIVSVWTMSVLIWAFQDVSRLTVSTWSCPAAPTSSAVTAAFLQSCTPADSYGPIRLGPSIYLWSMNDHDHWRWIVTGVGDATLRTPWPPDATQILLAPDTNNARFIGSSNQDDYESGWLTTITPSQSLHFNLFYIEPPENVTATP